VERRVVVNETGYTLFMTSFWRLPLICRSC